MFEGPADEFAVGSSAGPGGALKWPVFKWAGGKDDKFFARLGKNVISVYEAPDMVMHEKKSLKMDGVQVSAVMKAHTYDRVSAKVGKLGRPSLQ